MAAIAAPRLVDLLNLAAVSQASGFRVLQGTNGLALDETRADPSRVLALDWPELERVLPDRGFPRGVIEIASPNASNTSHRNASFASSAVMRGGATTIALSAIRAVHANANGANGWCAWITESTAAPLYAPAVAQAGVDLDRLLVVRPEPVDLARAVVKVASSGAFDLVVIDAPNGLDGKLALVSSGANGAVQVNGSRASHTRPPPRVDAAVIIRKLALAAEERGTTFIVLTNLYTPRAVPWPVALRLEVERRPEAIAVRVTKDRRGRASSQHVVRVAL